MTLKVRDIKVAMVRHRKTGRQVAAAVGLSPTAFSRLMHGHRRVDPKLLAAIEAAIRGTGRTGEEATAGAKKTPPAA